MTDNVGGADHGLPVVTGLALPSRLFMLDGNRGWIGRVGGVPLLAALAGNAPRRSIPGVSTCPLGPRR